MTRAALLLAALTVSGCAGSLTEVTVAPIPCAVQGRLGADVRLNPHQLRPDRDRGVCVRARLGPPAQ